MPISVRPIRIVGDIAIVPLTRGYEAVIDASDVSLVNRNSWQAKIRFRADGSIRTVYAVRSIREGGRNIMQSLHSIILGVPIVDHRDGNGLNCRKYNLRSASFQENARNKGMSCNNTSGFKGVTLHKSTGKWHSRITVNRKSAHLGLFSTKEEAAAAYAKASREFHGEFGRTT